MDYLVNHETTKNKVVQFHLLWELVIKGFGKIWPEGRTKYQGINLGDAWHSSLINDIVPFHKLSQWLTYSIIECLEVFCDLK